MSRFELQKPCLHRANRARCLEENGKLRGFSKLFKLVLTPKKKRKKLKVHELQSSFSGRFERQLKYVCMYVKKEKNVYSEEDFEKLSSIKTGLTFLPRE